MSYTLRWHSIAALVAALGLAGCGSGSDNDSPTSQVTGGTAVSPESSAATPEPTPEPTPYPTPYPTYYPTPTTYPYVEPGTRITLSQTGRNVTTIRVTAWAVDRTSCPLSLLIDPTRPVAFPPLFAIAGLGRDVARTLAYVFEQALTGSPDGQQTGRACAQQRAFGAGHAQRKTAALLTQAVQLQ